MFKKIIINTNPIGVKYSLTRLGILQLFHSSSFLLSNTNNNSLINTTETNTDPNILQQKLNTIKSYNELLEEKEEKENDQWKESSSDYSEAFGNVDNNDPFFGIIPKILRNFINNENIPLENLILEKGWLKSIAYILKTYPISTILKSKDKNINITEEDINVITELNDKLDIIDERVNSIENKVIVFEELDKKLDQIADRSVMALKAIDKGDMILLGLQFLSPFLIYRGILNTYGKLVIDNSYKPKSIEELEYIQKNRVRLINRFNRIGAPLLFVGYLYVYQMNIERNKDIIDAIKFSIVDAFKNESNGGGGAIKSLLFLFFTKNKKNILIFIIPVLMFLIGYFIKPVIFNNYPWLYDILKLYGLKFSISLIFLWVLILCLDYALELIIYNLYKNNNSKIKFPVIIEWLINARYSELWDQSQSTLKIEHNKFYVRNFYFHLFILFILFILLIYIFI